MGYGMRYIGDEITEKVWDEEVKSVIWTKIETPVWKEVWRGVRVITLEEIVDKVNTKIYGGVWHDLYR